jgi:hypothetical protein
LASSSFDFVAAAWDSVASADLSSFDVQNFAVLAFGDFVAAAVAELAVVVVAERQHFADFVAVADYLIAKNL